MSITADGLWDRYAGATADEALSLEEFLEQATSGALGEAVEPDVVREFLRRVEAMMLTNIEAKIEESPRFLEMREAAVSRTQAMITGLIERFGRPSKGPSALPG